MATPPPLSIPHSASTVSVSIINTTSIIRAVEAWKFLSPSVPGHAYLGCPAFSFLIRHRASDRTLVFDLGVRKDWWNSSPSLARRFTASGYRIRVECGVREILDAGGVDTAAIEAVIWSHWHWDHTGDPSTFEPATKLIVGPGFSEHKLPGYPADPDSSILESDYAGRELVELDFKANSNGLRIGRLPAIDYFGDGSFYLLDAPGHAVGHVCGLARVTSSPDSFVLMGGDAWHHAGEIRPSPWLPLPEKVVPHPFHTVPTGPLLQSSLGDGDNAGSDVTSSGAAFRLSGCPGALFEPLLRTAGDRTRPFYEPARLAQGQIHYDVDEALRTIGKLQEADGAPAENVLLAAAHDETLLDVADFFPRTADDFMAQGWVKKARWRFLRDFAKAVGMPGAVEGRREWGSLSDEEDRGQREYEAAAKEKDTARRAA